MNGKTVLDIAGYTILFLLTCAIYVFCFGVPV